MAKKKSILIDLDRLKNINTGLGQVALNFGSYLSKINDPNLEFTFLVPEKFKGYFGSSVSYEVLSLKRRYFPFLCKSFDLWHSIHQDSAYFPSNAKTPYLLTIHDLNFLGEKSPSKIKKRLARLQAKIDRSEMITTISNFTADDVKKHLVVNDKPLSIIYNGVEVKMFDNCKRPSFAPTGDLLFSIGVVQAKKNTKVLVDFMYYMPANYKLVIAGDRSGTYAQEIERRINDLGLGNRIIITGQISDEEKYWMLVNCKAVVFPSRFEGMGIPPIEAMRFGKPVFASTLSSIPEICKENAYYWTNFEPQYMSQFFLEKIKQVEKEELKIDILKKYAQQFDWSENVNKYILLFYSILGLNK